MADMPIVSFCHTINSNTTVIPKELTVAPYGILTILIFTFMEVHKSCWILYYWSWCTGSIKNYWVPLSLEPFFIISSILGAGSGEVHIFSFWFLPNYVPRSPSPFHHTLYMCQQSFILMWERKLSGFLWQHSPHCLIWQAAPNMARIISVTDPFFKALQSPQGFGKPGYVATVIITSVLVLYNKRKLFYSQKICKLLHEFHNSLFPQQVSSPQQNSFHNRKSNHFNLNCSREVFLNIQKNR